MEQPRIERVLRLMRLMSGNVYFTVDELAEKLDTSYRSIYRYIDTFKEVGFAVEKIHSNMYRLVKMPSQFKDLSRLVFFSEEEAEIVGNLIENLDETNNLKSTLRRKLAAVYDMTNIKKVYESKAVAANIQALGNAKRDGLRVVLKNYASGNSGVTRDRLVEPFEFSSNNINIWAYDVENDDVRSFKVNRIDWVDILYTEPWQFEKYHRKPLSDAFRMNGDKFTKVKIELNQRAKNLLVEEFPLAIPDVRNEDGRWIYEGNVCRMEGVGRFVLGLAADVKVIDSPELLEYLMQYSTKNVVQYIRQ